MSHLNQEPAHCQFGNANWKKILFFKSTLKKKKKNLYMHTLWSFHTRWFSNIIGVKACFTSNSGIMLLLSQWQPAIACCFPGHLQMSRVCIAGAQSCAKYLWGRGREILQGNNVQVRGEEGGCTVCGFAGEENLHLKDYVLWCYLSSLSAVPDSVYFLLLVAIFCPTYVRLLLSKAPLHFLQFF